MSRPGRRSARSIPTVAARALTSVAAFARIDPGIGPDPDQRVPADQLLALLERASELTGDEHLGLRLGASGNEKKRLGVVGFVIAASATVRDALSRSSRYHRLLNEALHVGLDESRTNGRASVTFGIDPAVAGHVEGVRHLFELATATAVGLIRATVAPSFAPLRVDYATRRPKSTGAVEAYFGAPVRYGQRLTVIDLPSEILDAQPRSADADLSEVLVRHAEDLITKLPAGARSWTDRVRLRLLEGSGAGLPSLDQVAHQLGVSVRSLQRRLREEATSFAHIEDAVRRELADRYVSASDLTSTEIAYVLGFNDLSAFYRAFRRWTGMTPVQLRARVV